MYGPSSPSARSGCSAAVRLTAGLPGPTSRSRRTAPRSRPGSAPVRTGRSGGGSLRTEVLTEDLKPVEDLTVQEADPVRGDGIRLEQKWNGDASAIERMAGRTIRMRFYLENTDLFSFRAGEAG